MKHLEALDLAVRAAEMVYQAQVKLGQAVEWSMGIQGKVWKGANPRSKPGIDLSLNGWCPHQIWSRWTPWYILCHRGTVHIIASAAVLCAVAATLISATFLPVEQSKERGSKYIERKVPLWEQFITPNMSLFTSLAALPGLGVTFSGRTSTRASHCRAA